MYLAKKASLMVILVFVLTFILLPLAHAETDGTWATKASMPTARYCAKAGNINGLLYVAGGTDGSRDLPTLEVYNPATNTWSSLASMPYGTYAGAVGVINGKLYVAGGWRLATRSPSNEPLPSSVLFVYDPGTNTWTQKASMPELSGSSVSGVISGKLYVHNPCDGQSGYRDHMFVYDPATDTWSTLTPLPKPHYSGVGVVIDGKFYIVGGSSQYPSNINDLDVYDPATNSWTTKASSPISISLAAGVINGKLYVVGSSDQTWSSSSTNTVCVYDPVTDAWSADKSSMPTAIANMAYAVINGQLYSAGGWSTGPVATLYVFNPPSPFSASASASPTSGTTPLTVQFTGSASGGNTPYSYSWSFGDGSSSTQQSPSHTYTTTGSYTATLTVTDSAGKTATTSATVTVSAQATRANPTVTVTPSSQSGAASSPLTFTISVKNNDPSTFGSSTFSLTYSVPSGWSASLSKSAVTVAPGSTDSSATLSVTSPSGASAGDYTISITATNAGAAGYVGNGAATYSVATPQPTAKPDLAILDFSWSPSSPKEGDVVTFTVAVKNQGGAPSPSFATVLYIEGQRSEIGRTSLAVGETRQFTYQWKAVVGSYTIKAVADDLGEIAESDEVNNAMSKTLQVTSAFPIEYLVVVLALISFTVVGGVALSRRRRPKPPPAKPEPLPPLAPPTAPSFPPPPPPSPRVTTMTCPNCGAVMPLGTVYCGKCGIQLRGR